MNNATPPQAARPQRLTTSRIHFRPFLSFFFSSSGIRCFIYSSTLVRKFVLVAVRNNTMNQLSLNPLNQGLSVLNKLPKLVDNRGRDGVVYINQILAYRK